MARKRGLGRGLGALIPTGTEEKKAAVENEKTTGNSGRTTANAEKSTKKKTASTKKTVTPKKETKHTTPGKEERHTTAETVLRSIQHLALDQIEPNPDQPRKTFNAESMAELSESIRTYGVLQPIVVEKYTAPGHAPYRIIAGERRYRAAKDAGLNEVPVVLRADHPEEQMLLSVVENVQRQDLNPVEEAVAYQHIMEERNMTQQELADALGKSRPYIANAVRLLRLDDASLDALREGSLTSSQARTLLAEKDLKKRAAYLKLLTEGRASVKEVENRRKKPKTTDAFLADVERRFSEALETNVAVISRRKGWSVQIACYNEEELNRLLERLDVPDQH